MSSVPFLQRFNWRAVLMRFVVNFLALVFTVWIVPHVAFKGENRILSVLVIAAAFALLNAFVKPLIQFLVLPLLFVSYGLVVVIINSLMIFLLAVVFRNRFVADRLFWVIVAGAIVGLLGNVFENLLGLSPPIMENPPSDLAARTGRVEAGPVAAVLGPATPNSSLDAPSGEAAEADEDAIPDDVAVVAATDSLGDAAPLVPPDDVVRADGGEE